MPPKKKLKTIDLHIRITEEEKRSIEYLESVTQKNQTEVVIDAVALMVLAVIGSQDKSNMLTKSCSTQGS